MRIALIGFVLAAAGCSQSSGVMKLGPDTYSVSTQVAPASGGLSRAKGLSLQEANKYCSSLGKNILVTNMNSSHTVSPPRDTSDITFKCLSSGDPELQRPEYKKEADIVIENK